MKRSTDAVIDLTLDSSQDDEPETKKIKGDASEASGKDAIDDLWDKIIPGGSKDTSGSEEDRENDDQPIAKKKKHDPNEVPETPKPELLESFDLTQEEEEDKEEGVVAATFQCKKCDFSCCSYQELQGHMYAKHREASGVEKPGQDKLYCDVCKVKSASEKHHEEHMKGAKHRKTVHRASINKAGGTVVAKPETFYCDLCSLRFTHKAMFDSHMVGERHRRRKTLTEGTRALEPQQVQETEVSKKPGIFTCNFCDISFFKEARYETHVAGEQHRRRKARMEGVEFFKFKNKSLDQHKNRDENFEVLLNATKTLVEKERVGSRVGGEGSSPGPSSGGRGAFGRGAARPEEPPRQQQMPSLFPSPEVFSHPSEAFRQRLCPDPETFRPVAEMLSCPVDLQFALQGAGRFSKLTEDMVTLFNSRQQLPETMAQKIALWTEIYKAVRTDMDAGLFVFGSTFNGFGAEGCDIDMCLFPQGPSMSDKQWLTQCRRLLERHCGHFIKGRIELINAKVPILKFFDRHGGLEVDLSVNNPTSIRNTHMLFCYSQADYRVRPLVLAVKLWAKEHGINEARFQTLSSYALTLMVLHYLQSGVFPPVLPCLQEELPAVFNPNSPIFSLPYEPPPWVSRNRQSLGELLCGFFSYYGNKRSFDSDSDVASVRKGMVLEQRSCEAFARMNKLSPGQWNARILLEEPFDRTNAARAVCSDQKWGLILEAFLATREVVEHSGSSLTLQDLRPRRPPRRF